MISTRGVPLLLITCCSALRFSKRAQAGSLSMARDDDETMPYCVFEGEGQFNSTVQVFVGKDNTRSLAFGGDDIGTQTQTKCKGDAPDSCLGIRMNKLADVQSCNSLSCPCEPDMSSLDFGYMVKMMDTTVPMCQEATGHFKSLLIGLGGAALPEYMLQHCPKGTEVESVEFDPRVVKAATNFFGLHLAPSVNEVETNDGGAAVSERAERGIKYDLVLVDCFESSGHVPDSCRNQAFAENIHKILKPGGKFIQQVWNPQLDSTLSTYQGVFGKDNSFAQDAELQVSWLIVSTVAEAQSK